MQPSELALQMKRVLPAPRPLVFKACTEPDELTKWWGPRGFTAPSVEVDLGVGSTIGSRCRSLSRSSWNFDGDPGLTIKP